MRLRRGRIAISATLAIAGCAAATPPPSGSSGVCDDLAREFWQIAVERDRGASRDSQIEDARRNISPAEIDPDAVLRYRVEAIGFVYERLASDPAVIEAFVRDNCIVGPRGQPVLYLPRS